MTQRSKSVTVFPG